MSNTQKSPLNRQNKDYLLNLDKKYFSHNNQITNKNNQKLADNLVYVINGEHNLNDNENNYNSIENFNRSEVTENLVEGLLLDKILDNYGYRLEIIKIIIISICLTYLSSYMIYHISCYLLVVKREFNLPDSMLTILACIAFFCKAIGCFFTGALIKVVSRRSLLLVNILILIGLNFFLTLVWKLWAYFIFLIIGCYIVGNIDPLNIDVLCESLPIQFRGFFLCFSYNGFPLNIFIYSILLN